MKRKECKHSKQVTQGFPEKVLAFSCHGFTIGEVVEAGEGHSVFKALLNSICHLLSAPGVRSSQRQVP